MMMHRSLPFLKNVKVCTLITHDPEYADLDDDEERVHLYGETPWHLELPQCYRLVAAVATCFRSLEKFSMKLALDGERRSRAHDELARSTLLGPLASLTELSQLTVFYTSTSAALQVGVGGQQHVREAGGV